MLSGAGLGLIYLQQIGWLSPLSMAAEWGFTSISIGVDIAVTYLIIDRLLLSDERKSWKVVEEQAKELIADQLKVIFLYLCIATGIINSLADDHKEKEHLADMRILADPANISILETRLAKLKIFTGIVVPKVIESLTGEFVKRLGELQLRYSSRFLDPKLVRLMADVENHLRHLGITISNLRTFLMFSKVTDTSFFDTSISKEDIQPLLKAFVDAVDQGVYAL